MTVVNKNHSELPYLSIRKAKIETKWLLYIAGGGAMDNGTATLENSWAVSYEVKIQLSYDPAIPFLGIDPSETKTYVHTETNMWVFRVALFTIAENWKQPSVLHRWMHDGLSIPRNTTQWWKGTCTVVTCNNNAESQLHYTKWKKRTQKATYCMLPCISHSGEGKPCRDREHRSVPSRV